MISIDEKGNIQSKEFAEQTGKNSKVSPMKYSDNRCFITWYRAENCTNWMEKVASLFRVRRVDSKTSRISINTVHSSKPFKLTSTTLFDVNSGKADAFDGTKDGQLFVIVEEKNVEQSQKTERTVLLFHRDDSDPFTTYTPSDAGFMPADVCFWQDNGQTKLLVADPQNDCVHVVNIEDDGCRFERYLAAGSGDLVRPTVLEHRWRRECLDRLWQRVDSEVWETSRLWIVTGWLWWRVHCVRRVCWICCSSSPCCSDGGELQPTYGCPEPMCLLDLHAVPRDDLLLVDNSSQSTDVQSQVSQ